ncbi:MAG: hypothetical protein ACFB9M_04850 [Myxococcota bacterium]
MNTQAMVFSTIALSSLLATACYDEWSHDDDEYRYDSAQCPPPQPIPVQECSTQDCPSGLSAIYLSADATACAAIDFDCSDGLTRFDSACGCGCQAPEPTTPADESCPDAEDPDVLYLNTEPKVCDGIEFSCPDGQERFDSECGCGCRPTCPDSADPLVHYLSEEPMVCASISFTCPDECIPFDDRCGCGCVEPEIPSGCPNPDDPLVTYISGDPDICAEITVNCPEHCTPFNDDCGCGCID